jgi:hypothetical protein
MKEAYRLTRKDGAPGIDGVGAADYATNLEAKIGPLMSHLGLVSRVTPVHTANAVREMEEGPSGSAIRC